jgi:hypothetical protein
MSGPLFSVEANFTYEGGQAPGVDATPVAIVLSHELRGLIPLQCINGPLELRALAGHDATDQLPT